MVLNTTIVMITIKSKKKINNKMIKAKNIVYSIMMKIVIRLLMDNKTHNGLISAKAKRTKCSHLVYKYKGMLLLFTTRTKMHKNYNHRSQKEEIGTLKLLLILIKIPQRQLILLSILNIMKITTLLQQRKNRSKNNSPAMIRIKIKTNKSTSSILLINKLNSL